MWHVPTCDVRDCKRRGAVIHIESQSLYCKTHARKTFASYRVRAWSA